MTEVCIEPEVVAASEPVAAAAAGVEHRLDQRSISALIAAVDATGSAAEAPPRIQLVVQDVSPATERLLVDAGFGTTRELLQLRRSLPLAPGLAAGGTPAATRPFVPGLDDQRWLEVNNRAFAWHPEQSNWTPAMLHERLGEPWFDPDGFLLLERDGELAGYCWTKVHPATASDPALGEIFVIGVDPNVQGSGLGRQLVLAGLEHLAGRGVEVAMLYVEADNAPARKLYERLGFAVHTRRTWFVRSRPR